MEKTRRRAFLRSLVRLDFSMDIQSDKDDNVEVINSNQWSRKERNTIDGLTAGNGP
jgi:hypothetical protein